LRFGPVAAAVLAETSILAGGASREKPRQTMAAIT
jgi:hypothetical protein